MSSQYKMSSYEFFYQAGCIDELNRELAAEEQNTTLEELILSNANSELTEIELDAIDSIQAELAEFNGTGWTEEMIEMHASDHPEGN